MALYTTLILRRVIHPITNCWLYTLGQDKDGYGKIKYKGKTYRVHILSYKHFVGEPKQQVLHKLECPHKHCFNPEHLYDGSHSDNMKDRKASGNYINYNKFNTHCIRGHDLKTSYIFPKTGYRQCRICRELREGNAT